MSGQTPQTDNTIIWLSEPELPGHPLRPALRGWLTDDGLLTARMRRLCPDEFRLAVLANRAAEDSTATTVRRVILWCGGNACIYAETALPARTLELHPWLNQLGEEPLGETLQRRPGVSRGPFDFALLSPEQLPVSLAEHFAGGHFANGVAYDVNEALWARRSAFMIGPEALTVTEIFLPGVTDCESQRIHVAE
jgi:chorismate--pyruvate lyase